MSDVEGRAESDRHGLVEFLGGLLTATIAWCCYCASVHLDLEPESRSHFACEHVFAA